MNVRERLKELEAAVNNAACDACGFGATPTWPMTFEPLEIDAVRLIEPPPPTPCRKCGRLPALKFFPITLDGDKIANAL